MICDFAAHFWSAKYVQKLMGNRDLENTLQKLDRLTHEEARMAAVELMKTTHVIDDGVKGVDRRIQGIDSSIEHVGHNERRINSKVQGHRDSVRDANHKLDLVNRSSTSLSLFLITMI
jgi:hypothetical protein